MVGTTFWKDLGNAADLAAHNSRRGLLVHIELGKYGFVVMGSAPSSVRAVVRDYKQVVPYIDAELTDGRALTEAIKKVVVGLKFDFIEPTPIEA